MASNVLPVKILTNIPNLYLRSPVPTAHDAEGISKVLGHKYNTRFSMAKPGQPEPTPSLYANRIPKWTEMAKMGKNCFCVIALEPGDSSSEDEIIGFGGFNVFSMRPAVDGNGEIKVASIGIMLHEPFTGKGYGIASLIATIQAAFDVFGSDAIEAETNELNVPFHSLMRKLKLDHLRAPRSNDDGFGDVLYYVTKADWEKAQQPSSS